MIRRMLLYALVGIALVGTADYVDIADAQDEVTDTAAEDTASPEVSPAEPDATSEASPAPETGVGTSPEADDEPTLADVVREVGELRDTWNDESLSGFERWLALIGGGAGILVLLVGVVLAWKRRRSDE